MDIHDAACKAAPYGDDAEVGRITRDLVAAGHRLFQIHRLADTDAEHVAALLALADLPIGAAVLDAGCGVGSVAEMMASQRPDLSITLLNVSRAQLEMCPEGFPQIEASFHEVPVPAGSFDAVLFLYSLGHGRLHKALSEAARILRPGGVVFIYDLMTPAPERVASTLGYVPHSAGNVLEAAASCGLAVTSAAIPQTNVDEFLTVLPRASYDWVFAGVAPVYYRMVKS